MYNKKVNFGFELVEENLKQPKVQQVFSDVAHRYDIMNDLMSFGLHRIWKNRLISEIRPQSGNTLLDLAGGTGDIAERFIINGGSEAIVCDLNPEMLKYGQEKRIDHNQHHLPIKIVHANAEALPFEDDNFDYCTISFGIRNVTNIPEVLKEAYRVLKPGGKFLCLEFCQVDSKMLSRIYNLYSFNVIPKLGKIITGHSEHYKYLVESIKIFPEAHVFAHMMEEARFESVKFTKLTFGVVAIHSGYKI